MSRIAEKAYGDTPAPTDTPSLFAQRQARRPFQEDELIVLLRQPKVIRRFEKKVIPEPNTGCSLWLGAVGREGHGQFFICTPDGRRGLIGAHRASWMIYRGPLLPEELACHTCDTPSCVNHEHLFSGTQLDNMRDCITKGRMVFLSAMPGEKNPAAILSDSDVANIRLSTRNLSDLAHHYGVSKSSIHEAKTGITFSHLPGAHAVTPKRTLTQAEREEIANSQEPTGALVRRMSVAYSTVCRLRGPFMRPSAAAKLSETLHRLRSGT